MNICVFHACYFYNTERQLFCRPVPWATILIILFCASFLILPFITKQTKFLNILASFCGLGIFISIYTLLFARQEYLIFLSWNIPFFLALHLILWLIKKIFKTNIFDAFYLYPAIILTPFLLLFQLWLLLKNLQTKTQKQLFIVIPVFIWTISLILTIQINNIIHRIHNATDIEKESKEIVSNHINNYLTELILGAHWKYHTELCLYDGWRPPFHDPVLVISNKILYPNSSFASDFLFYPFQQKPRTDIPNAFSLYKKLYPNNPTEFDCKCANHENLFDF